MILSTPLFSKIEVSSKKIERTGAKTFSPGDLNQTVVKVAKTKLKTKDLKKILFIGFTKRNAIKIETVKYNIQKRIISFLT